MTVRAGKGREHTCMKSSKQNRCPRQSIREACYQVTQRALGNHNRSPRTSTLRSLCTHIQQLHRRLMQRRLSSSLPQIQQQRKVKQKEGLQNHCHLQEKFVAALKEVMAAPNSNVKITTQESVLTRSRSQKLAASAVTKPLSLISSSSVVGRSTTSEEAPIKSPAPALGLPAAPVPAATLRSKPASPPCALDLTIHSKPTLPSTPTFRSKSTSPNVLELKVRSKSTSPEVIELLNKSTEPDEQSLVLNIKKELPKVILDSEISIKQEIEYEEEINVDTIDDSDLSIKQELNNNSQKCNEAQEEQLVDVVDCKLFLSEVDDGKESITLKKCSTETQNKRRVLIIKPQIPSKEEPEKIEKKLTPIAPKFSFFQGNKKHLINIHSQGTGANQQTSTKNIRILPMKPAIVETKSDKILSPPHSNECQTPNDTPATVPENKTNIEPVNAMRKIFKTNRKTVKYNFSLDHNDKKKTEFFKKNLPAQKRKNSPEPPPACCDTKKCMDEEDSSQGRDTVMFSEDCEYHAELDKLLSQSLVATEPLWRDGELEDVLASYQLNECPFNFETPPLEELLGIDWISQSETSPVTDTSEILNPYNNLP